MPCLPSRFAAVILAFAPVFQQQRTWRHAELLLVGAILAPGRRTVASILRITGLAREPPGSPGSRASPTTTACSTARPGTPARRPACCSAS
jgi:hypothetical protein